MADYIEHTLSNRLFRNIDGKQITWRHMEDNAGDGLYSRNGVRYFAIKLSDELAEELEQEGWPVIWRNVNRDEDDPEEIMKGYLKVFIKFGTRFPCDIYLINADMESKTLLDETDLDNLHIDNKKIDYIDLLIRPYYWTYGNDHGVKAQVESMNIMLAQSGIDDGLRIVYKND